MGAYLMTVRKTRPITVRLQNAEGVEVEETALRFEFATKPFWEGFGFEMDKDSKMRAGRARHAFRNTDLRGQLIFQTYKSHGPAVGDPVYRMTRDLPAFIDDEFDHGCPGELVGYLRRYGNQWWVHPDPNDKEETR